MAVALLLAYLAVPGLVGTDAKQEASDVAEVGVLSERVLAENLAGDDKGRQESDKEENSVSKTEAYPYLYAKGTFTEQELPEKVVFLTFDDGPSKNTIKILDTLKQYQVPATFFLIGENLTQNGVEIARRAVEEGHMLGMHTETHQYDKIYHSVDSFLSDYDKLAVRFVEAFGECPAVFRFPGGSYSAYINPIKGDLKEEMERRGFLCYDWNVSGEDSVGTPTAASIKKNIFDSIEGQEQPIVLLHDSPCSNLTAEVLPSVIEELLEKGYEFRTLQCRKPYQFPW